MDFIDICYLIDSLCTGFNIIDPSIQTDFLDHTIICSVFPTLYKLLAFIAQVWKEHYDKISNEEFSWDMKGLTEVKPVCGPGEKISEVEVEAAIGKMKLGKAAGPSGVVADMLKAAGDDGTRWMTELCNTVVRDGKIPKDWSRSWLVNVYKGKGDALACGSYRGIKLV